MIRKKMEQFFSLTKDLLEKSWNLPFSNPNLKFVVEESAPPKNGGCWHATNSRLTYITCTYMLVYPISWYIILMVFNTRWGPQPKTRWLTFSGIVELKTNLNSSNFTRMWKVKYYLVKPYIGWTFFELPSRQIRAILCAIRESACNNGLLGSKREEQGLLNSKREEVILLRRTCCPRDRTLLKKRADRPHR